MTNIISPQPRISSHPWSLYQAEHLAKLASRKTREGFYSHMLSDDLSKRRYAYEILFVPHGLDRPRASELMFALLNDFNHSGYSRDPANLICDLVNGLFLESADGKALFLELFSLPTDHNRAKRRARRQKFADEADKVLPSLGLIPNWSVKQTRVGLSQVSPSDRQGTITIPRKRIHRLEIDRHGSAVWSRAVKRLQYIDATKLTDAGVDRLAWIGYSFSDVVAAQNLAVAASTAEIGWDGRGTFEESVTSSYLTFRRLRFTKFWVEALQESVAFLNRFTTSETLYGQDAFSFSLAGLPTTSDLAQAMDNIRNGTLTVADAYKSYLFPKYAKHKSDSAHIN